MPENIRSKWPALLHAFAVVFALLIVGAVSSFASAAVEPPDAPPSYELSEVPISPAYSQPVNVTYTLGEPTTLIDGQIDLTKIILGMLGLVASVATAWLTLQANKLLNRDNDIKRAETIAVWSKRAVDAAANYVEGALAGHPVTFKVGQEWVERALEQCLELFPDLVAQAGGENAQRRRLWSYIQVHQDEAVPAMAPVQLVPVKPKTSPPGAQA